MKTPIIAHHCIAKVTCSLYQLMLMMVLK